MTFGLNTKRRDGVNPTKMDEPYVRAENYNGYNPKGVKAKFDNNADFTEGGIIARIFRSLDISTRPS